MPDQQILVEIDRVVVRCRRIATRVQDRPWPRAEERFTAHCGERRLDAGMGHIERRHHLLGIGAADDRQLGLGHCLLHSARDDNERQA
jgi:hypothetical protein